MAHSVPCGGSAAGPRNFIPARLLRKPTAAYAPFDYPENAHFADLVTDPGLTGEERYAAYDHDNDPAHPVLDTAVKVSISNLGSQPGAPRPQDIDLEYPNLTLLSPSPAPTPSPSATLNPGVLAPGIKPGIKLPEIELPELYILNPAIDSPQTTGGSYDLAWEYTAGRKALFSVSLSVDGGKTFQELSKGIEGKTHTFTFPDAPADRCILRVTALVEGQLYKTADTDEFALETALEIIRDYVDPQVQYTDIPGLRISNAADGPVWFNAESSAPEAHKLVWQLSKTPFWGTKESCGQDTGILATGEIAKAGGEFSVDLAALCEQLNKPDAERAAGLPFLRERDIYEFYLRVVALDSGGACIGDPGRGISFSYGPPDVAADDEGVALISEPNIQIQMYLPYYEKHKWQRINPKILNRNPYSESDGMCLMMLDPPKKQESAYGDKAESWLDKAEDTLEDAIAGANQEDPVEEVALNGSDIIGKAVQVEVQVATSPFTELTVQGLTSPAGLVYSSLDAAPDIGYTPFGYFYQTPKDRGIEYKQFVPSKEELNAIGGVFYYARCVFYVPDSVNPSVLRPYPSEAITIAYRGTDSSKNEIKNVTVESNIPFVQFLRYVPVQWQDPHSDNYFEVARHIEAEDMQYFSIRNNETGDFLLPYKTHIAQFKWTREQYQAKLDEMLPVGASFRYVKPEPGFWDEFFGLLKDIFTSVSKAYADAKAAIVNLVDYLPVGDGVKGILKAAVSMGIDYGLACIGLPPSLPNLEPAGQGGLDYVVKVAVTEAASAAGVPPDSVIAQEITEEVRGEVVDAMSDELTRAMLAQQQNPLKADYLRISTEKLYEPAYVDVFVANYSKTKTTPAGEVIFRCGSGFDVYKTRVVYIPALLPGEHMVIRLYLDHLRNQYDGYNAHFDEIYNGNSGKPYKMSVYADFNLPNPFQAAKDQGVSPAPLPYMTEFVYDRTGYNYEREFIPADAIWDEDDSVNPADFQD